MSKCAERESQIQKKPLDYYTEPKREREREREREIERERERELCLEPKPRERERELCLEPKPRERERERERERGERERTEFTFKCCCRIRRRLCSSSVCSCCCCCCPPSRECIKFAAVFVRECPRVFFLKGGARSGRKALSRVFVNDGALSLRVGKVSFEVLLHCTTSQCYQKSGAAL